jgi:glycosyltransferase involved in cell wall biosynthesis
MVSSKISIKLMHVTTVPESLWSFLRGQIGYMQARGFEVHGMSSPGEWLDKFAEHEHVQVHTVEMPRQVAPMNDLVAAFHLYLQLHRIRPHIIHVHTPKAGLLGMLSAWFAHVPVRIYHIHGLPLMTAGGLKRSILWWSEKIACLLAHQILCVSYSVREVALVQRLCPPEKIKVLLNGSINGVDAMGEFNPTAISRQCGEAMRSRYGIPRDALVLGFAGRIVLDKGVLELATAWSVLREEFPDLHLLIVGPFEIWNPLPKEIDDLLHCDLRIHLAGSTRDMRLLYAAMDLVVLPTHREGLPLVPLEAAAMMLPVVATQIPGCVDAIQDGVTGTLVPCQDVDALAVAIRRYLLDAELRHKHGQAGRDRVLREFGQEPMWEAVYQEYVTLLQERNLSL